MGPMQRKLDDIAGRDFDLAVIGGGIVGAFCACDAARRGLRVLIVEAADFGAAASEAMSHLVHGGIRYLAQAQFGLVREGLVERNRWRRLAPHRVVVQTFLIPLRKGAGGSAFALRTAVSIYDRLGRGLEGAARPRMLDANAAIELEPALANYPLQGAIAYDDCRVDEPERAVIALVADAVAHGLSATARVITAAAAIMVMVFLSFVVGPNRTVKEFGIGLATAIFVDATIVRLMLVPATMELLGDANWWLPRWLDRLLPSFDVEGVREEEAAGVAAD